MSENSRCLARLLCASLLSLTAACGGGGGSGGGSGSPAPPPVTNIAPFASAGADQSVDGGASVELDASASNDADGSIASFSWAQSEGPQVVLQNSDSVLTSFTAPEPTIDTQLVFTVTVTDDEGASAVSSVTITIVAPQVSERVTVAGRIIPSPSQNLDGDTNDPFNPLLSNDDPTNPQRLNTPTTLGGYVNEAGAGADGRSKISGDREDFYLVDMLAGQSINLLVARFQDADADLYLYTVDGELLDSSIGTGQIETISVAESGSYVVNVSIFFGATNYTLAIGSALTPAAHSGQADVIPWQAIVDYEHQGAAAQRRELAQALGMRELGGGARRARLMQLEVMAHGETMLAERLGAQKHRRGQFYDMARAARWETLMAIKHLARKPGVRVAEPNYRLRPLATVNDEAYSFQWHYPLINIPGAWDSSTGSPEVVVAVVDTGVLGGHPDLAGQFVDGYDFIRSPFEAADGDGIDPNPEDSIGNADPGAANFHGTHVSGTVAARGNNRIGVTGVAFTSRIMPLRALNASGGTSYDINQAIRYAAGLDNDSGTLPAQPADIINLSIGGAGFSQTSQNLYNELRARGIIVVAAAGNEGSSLPSYPASYENVISVSAVDAQQRLTNYSNIGNRVDVAAPGGDGSRDFNGDGYPDGVLSTGGSDGEFAYTFLSGTSMAAPHVAGVIALMKSVNPGLDADDVDRLLSSGAMTDDLGVPGRDDRYGHGLINARKAVDAALADAGENSTVAPRLAASSTALNFGTVRDTLELILRNSGSGELMDVTLSADQPWIQLQAEDVQASGLGRYSVRVSRDGLEAGVYEGRLTAGSSANSLTVRILMSIADSEDSELGQVYLLLFDPAADQVVQQVVAEPDGNGYRYTLPPVPPGRYQVFAGTDLDNDLLICDSGEACGAYLTIDQPLTQAIEEDRGDIDFPIEFLIALPGTAGAASDGTIRAHPLLIRQDKSP